MKRDQLILRVPPGVKRAIKAKARHRSLNAEVLHILEREAQEPAPIKGRELAQRLREARKVMTEQEHREFALDVDRGREMMRRLERPLEP